MITKKQKLHRAGSLMLLATVMVTIFCLSAQDSTDSAQVSGSVVSWLYELLKIDLPDGTVRAIAHCCEFAALGFLTLNALRAFRPRFKPLLSVVFAFLYAVTDEIHQLFVPGRAFQLIDLAIDLTGIVLGTIAFILLIKIIKNKNKSLCS
ncbi:MAG: VanZ family protein [Clostridia bacterium]|nr:VanZ family protein [Clostridia bacterium]